MLNAGQAGVLAKTAEDVFDYMPDVANAKRFLENPNFHLAVAINNSDVVVGMASAIDYAHPDKPLEMWINELGVAPEWQNRGIGQALTERLLRFAKERGCTTAWLGTEYDNAPARRVYQKCGGKEEPFVMYSFDLQKENSEAQP